MPNKKSNNKQPGPEIGCPILDKYLLVMKLNAHISESGDIAEYIDDNVHYGRALGYAEGKHAAYIELAGRILEGEFDPELEIKEEK